MNLRVPMLPVIYSTLALSFLVLSGTAQAGMHALGQALSDHGWQVESERDGTLVVVAGHTGNRAAVDDSAELPPRYTVETLPEKRSLVERLAAAGWDVNRADDGCIHLMVRGVAGGDEVDEVTSKPTSDRYVSEGAHSGGGLRQRLAAGGWRAVREADGSVVFSVRFRYSA